MITILVIIILIASVLWYREHKKENAQNTESEHPQSSKNEQANPKPKPQPEPQPEPQPAPKPAPQPKPSNVIWNAL